MSEKIKPYIKEAEKKGQVADMFDNIAHSYDFLNHLFSMGIDKMWRKKVVRMMKKHNPEQVLDVATGTGDFAVQAIQGVGAQHVIGVDISEGMLDVGRKKIAQKNLQDAIELEYGDSENLRFEDDSFDAFTVGFGVRNFQDLNKGLQEMCRVLKSGGKGYILELSEPKKFPMRQMFLFYFRWVMPALGKLVSKDHRAYSYLPESVAAFPEGKKFKIMMETAGYRGVKVIPLSGGICTLYVGEKC